MAGYSYGTISNSYASGNVDGRGWGVGGLAGGNGGTISNSYAIGNVSGDQGVGGLVGDNWGGISNSYASGDVSGTNWFVGGLVGSNDYEGGTISNSYAIGAVTCTDGICVNLGGLTGANIGSGSVSDSYYKSETEQSDEGKGTAKTTEEMKTQAAFEGWDFPGIWVIDEGNDYPKLSWSVSKDDYSPWLTDGDAFESAAIAPSGLTYTGDSIKPAVTISGLNENTDFNVRYFDNVNAGGAWALIWGIGDYAGKGKVIDFTITPKSLSGGAIQAISDQTFTGIAITPNVVVQDNTKVLTKDVDYTLAFSNNTEVSSVATVTASGKGNYTGTTSAVFNIIAESSSSSSEGGTDPIIADGNFGGSFDLQAREGMLWVSVPLSRNGVSVQLYALNGAKVRSLSLASGAHSVSLKDLPKGMYIAKASFGSERRFAKVMVK